LRFRPLYQWQFKQADGRIRFAGGSAVGVEGAGAGLTDALFQAVERSGATIAYGTRAVSLIEDERGAVGVRARQATGNGARSVDLTAGTVVLAAGGFEANPEWRTRYLGPGWSLAKVRGPLQHRRRLAHGARRRRHALRQLVGLTPRAGTSARPTSTTGRGAVFKRDDFLTASWSMPAASVRRRGRRHPRADLRKMGRAILAQPGQIAWQVFDRTRTSCTMNIARRGDTTRGDTLAELASRMSGIDGKALEATVEGIQSCGSARHRFDPGKKDGRSTVGLAVPKSNWARPSTSRRSRPIR
jgi:tricarballylate dehydrogenase